MSEGRHYCPRCTWEIEPTTEQCPRCKQVLRDFGQQAGAPAAAQIGLPIPPAETQPKPTPNIKILLIALSVGLLAFFAWSMFRDSGKFPSVVLAPAQSYLAAIDPCVLAAECVVVYVAPWCSACQQSVATINELAGEWSGGSIGLKVIVGQDTIARVEEMARQVHCPVFVDPTGALWQELGVEGVPHWFVLDRQNRIVRNFGGTYSPLFYHVSKLGLE